MITVIVVVVLVVVGALVLFGVALARKGKRRFAEQAGGPGLAPNAPPEWAGAHTPEARMHRRLAAAARSLDAQPMGDAVAIEQRVAIEQQIRQLDEKLFAVAGGSGGGKADTLSEMETMVASIERAVAQLAGTGVDMEQLRRGQAQLDAGEAES